MNPKHVKKLNHMFCHYHAPNTIIHFNEPHPHHGKTAPVTRVFTTTGDATLFPFPPPVSKAVSVVSYSPTTMHCGSHLAAVRSLIKQWNSSSSIELIEITVNWTKPFLFSPRATDTVKFQSYKLYVEIRVHCFQVILMVSSKVTSLYLCLTF